jgi:predicted Zn-dependent protease
MSTAPESWAQELQENPGSLVFINYGEYLRKQGRLSDALLVCLRGLDANPNADKGRLLLARTYYELGCTAFAVRELTELLRTQSQNEILLRLVKKLAPDFVPGLQQERPESTATLTEELLAESEFDFDSLQSLQDKK